jgi:hypothetical protein
MHVERQPSVNQSATGVASRHGRIIGALAQEKAGRQAGVLFYCSKG